MQIADRFHLHHNLMDAVNKIHSREIPSTNAVPIEETAPTPNISLPKGADAAHEYALESEAGKKIPIIVDNLTESERKRLEFIHKIQEFHQEGISIREIARITDKNRNTVKKHMEGDPLNLCRSNKHGVLESFKDIIIKAVQEGVTQTAIVKRLEGQGYTGTASNARQYISSVVREYGMEIAKYSNTCLKNGAGMDKKASADYITRKGLFNYLWMGIELTCWHHDQLWKRYPVLQEIELYIRQFREIFEKKYAAALPIH